MQVLEIIPVEGDIEHSEGKIPIFLGKKREHALRDFVSPAADAYEGDRLAGGLGADGVSQSLNTGGDFFGSEGTFHESGGKGFRN